MSARELPGMGHLEAWVLALTDGCRILDFDARQVEARVQPAERDAERFLRVALKTPATRASRRATRLAKARSAMGRATYEAYLAGQLAPEQVVGDVRYDVMHALAQLAQHQAAQWLEQELFAEGIKRPVAA